MSRFSPALALFLASLVILAVSFLRPVGPAPTEPLQTASTNASGTSSTAGTGSAPVSAPTPAGDANASANDPRADDPAGNASTPASGAPANESASGSVAHETANDSTQTATDATKPALKSVNQTVSWNVSLGTPAAACVPAFGLPVCAPDPSASTSSAPSTRSKALGAQGARVERGALNVSWSAQGGVAGVRATLFAGAGCDGDACEATRDLNLTSASVSSPFRLMVDGPIDLASNETLLLVIEPDCDNGSGSVTGSCDSGSTTVNVRGWLVRLVAE